MATQLRKAEVLALITAGEEILAGDTSDLWMEAETDFLRSAVDKLKIRYYERKWGGKS